MGLMENKMATTGFRVYVGFTLWGYWVILGVGRDNGKWKLLLGA